MTSRTPATRAATAAAAALVLACGPAFAQKGETVRIAWIDPLTGLMAPVGQNQLKSFEFLAARFNASNPAGVKFEIVPIDNKLSPAETINALHAAIDQGVRYVTQGDGSSMALALVDAVDKYNERHPGKEVAYLDYAAVDPDLTNAKCSFWHVRLDADTTMKMAALTAFIRDQKDIHKVYLIGQNYSHGRQVARYAREDLARVRPDIQIVGDELHPLAQVRDFAPYVAKIKASGADAVITGNWGSDLTLLVKAAHDAGLDHLKFYTYYAQATGTPTALGADAAGRVFYVGYGHANMGGAIGRAMKDFHDKFHDDLYTLDIWNEFSLLSGAMAKAHSTDPGKVLSAMEGLKVPGFNGEIELRAADHQVLQPLFIADWRKADATFPYSVENTGYTFAPVREIDAATATTPTTCRMKRPG